MKYAGEEHKLQAKITTRIGSVVSGAKRPIRGLNDNFMGKMTQASDEHKLQAKMTTRIGSVVNEAK